MANIPERDQALLRESYLEQSTAEEEGPPLATDDESLQTIVRRANVQTGARDLIVLAVSSFFALLLVFFAPVAKLSQKANAEISKVKGPRED